MKKLTKSWSHFSGYTDTTVGRNVLYLCEKPDDCNANTVPSNIVVGAYKTTTRETTVILQLLAIIIQIIINGNDNNYMENCAILV